MAQWLRTLAALPGLLRLALSPKGGLQRSVTLVPGNLRSSFGLCRHCMRVSLTDTCRGDTYAHKIKINKPLKFGSTALGDDFLRLMIALVGFVKLMQS